MTAYRSALDDYLSLRRSLGHELADAARLLPRFVDHLEATGTSFVTTEVALDWAQGPEAEPGSTVWPRRMMAARGFARYLTGIDARTEVPPVGVLPFSPRPRRQPYIYSDFEVAALMAEARRAIPTPFRAATYATLIGLLASTGLRIGEAIRLQDPDVDRDGGVLIVRESKFGKSRQVPVLPSTVEALDTYAEQRRGFRPRSRCNSFFVSMRGTPLIYTDFCVSFGQLRDGIGIGANWPTRPRIHDLRHSFAVHRLVDWYRDGADVQHRMAWLATYLGHRDPRSTYVYLSATPELLGHAARLLEASR